MFVIQLARAAGYRVIASASPRSFDLVKSYGAEHVVSYADHPAAVKEIHDVTGGGVSKGLDCVGGKANMRFAVDAFGAKGGQLVTLLPGGKSHRSNVQVKDVLIYRYLGKVREPYAVSRATIV
jgi:NADPH:quinone reductase-like Zn-dependent oxidoreductase